MKRINRKANKSDQRYGVTKDKRCMITACMMVKNEEKFLSQCLESVKDYVDEIVIVDTGSTDSTVDIAKKYTDKIFFHPWEGDFSKHRNQSIGYATKDWIFILDADEVLMPGCGEQVIEAIQDGTIDSVQVIVKNAFDKGRGEAVHNSTRIFKNNGIIHYEGRVHNLLVGEKSSKIYPITILHEGYNLSPKESRKKFERTSGLLKREIKENPHHPRAHHYLAASYLSESMYDKAIDSAIRAINLAEDGNYHDNIYLWTHFIAGISYLKTNKLDEAEKICLRAINKNPDHLDSYYLLAIIYFNKNNFDKSIYHSNEFLRLFDKLQKKPDGFGTMIHNTVKHRWRVHLHKGVIFKTKGNKDIADKEFQNGLSLCENKDEYYSLLAVLHVRISEFSLAERYLHKALKFKPEDIDLYLTGAQIYHELGKKDKEKEFLEKIIKRDVNEAEYFFRLGTIYLEDKQYSESSHLLEKVIEMDENHLGARINLGIIARRSGDLNKALTHINKALDVSQNSLEALSNLGYVHFDRNDFLKAKEIFEYLSHLHPTLIDIPLMLSMIYIRIGSIEPVVAECDKVLGLLEMDRNITLNSVIDLSNLFINIGEVLLKKKLYKLGILAFDVASHLNDGSDVILKKIGDICLQKEHYHDSLKYLEKAIRLNPEDWESFFIMGSCYEKMGVKESAAICYENARALNPNKASLKNLPAQL